MSDSAGTWHVERREASVADLHGVGAPNNAAAGRLVRICRPLDSALVIGSTQAQPDQSELPVVRRRSGGGAVLVEPGGLVWIDVFVPAGDALWSDDVSRAFLWLGRAWAEALGGLGVTGLSVHGGGLNGGSLARLVCFAGVGPGEVTVAGNGKAVGLCQRRGRPGALFQCAVLRAWEPARLARLVGLDRAAAGRLEEVAVSFADLGVDEIEDGFVGAVSAIGRVVPGGS